MILNKGLWVSITLDGIEASISQTYKGHAFLTLYGPEREKGNPWSAYSLFGGLPADNDNSPFAVLYRKLNGIAKEIGMEGPHGENHPAVFRRFEYIHTEPPVRLLEKLTQGGIVIKVAVVDHKGDDAEVEATSRDFRPWIDGCTVFKPNPKIEEDRKRAEEKVYWDARHKEAERKDRLLQKFVYLPVLVLMVSVAGYCAVTSHWWIALATVFCPFLIYAGFVLWFVRRY